MEQTINLEELGTLREKARKKTSAVHPREEAPSAAVIDLRQAGQPSASQTQGLEILHKNCARKIADALGTLLRAGLEVNLVSVEQVSCAAFLDMILDSTYLASLAAAPGASALLQMDLSLVFPILDLLLGGAGKDVAEVRDLTEIEQEIFEPVGRGIGRALREGWQPVLNVDWQWGRPLQKSEAAALLSPADNLLVVTFQARLQEAEGQILLAFPSTVSTALLRKFAPQEHAPKPSLPRGRGRLRECLLESRFEAQLLLPQSTVSIRQLWGLQPGDVLVLKVRSNEPLPVHVAGRAMFLAAPVRCGSLRGAQVQKVLSIVPKEEAEEKQ